jgi:hypothetical protein
MIYMSVYIDDIGSAIVSMYACSPWVWAIEGLIANRTKHNTVIIIIATASLRT